MQVSTTSPAAAQMKGWLRCRGLCCGDEVAVQRDFPDSHVLFSVGLLGWSIFFYANGGVRGIYREFSRCMEAPDSLSE